MPRSFGRLDTGEEADLREALADADADWTVLIDMNEYLQRMTTDELRRIAERDGYELDLDFAEYQL